MEHRTAFTKPNATYQDVIDAPEGMRAEIVQGDLYLQPRPASPHGYASDILAARLIYGFQLANDGPGGWWIKIEPEIHFEGEKTNVLDPDLAGWRRERLPVYPRVPYMTLAPDWVCEIASPSTARRDRGTKSDVYLAHGVAHYWILDPSGRTLEAFERSDAGRDAERWVRIGAWGDDDRVSVAPFDAVTLDLGELWLEEPSQ